jgi:hypothetical protein
VTQQESDRLFENLKKLSSKDSLTSHPIFHVMCMTLAVNYIGLAETNLKSGDLRGALAALDSLAQILPELVCSGQRDSRQVVSRITKRSAKGVFRSPASKLADCGSTKFLRPRHLGAIALTRK